MCCVQLFIEGGGKKIKIHPLALITNYLFSASLPYPIHNTFTNLLHHSVTFSLIPFPTPPTLFSTAMLPYPPCTLIHIPPATRQPLKFCSCHLPAPINSSQIPHVTNKCSTSSPAPLLHITKPSSIILLHLILSSNNPAEPVLSLKSNLTTS